MTPDQFFYAFLLLIVLGVWFGSPPPPSPGWRPS